MIKRVDLGGRSLNVFDLGRGPVLLWVHGFPLNHQMWSGQLEYFAQNYRVLAPDLRGFGGSDLAGAEMLGMDNFADDLRCLLDVLHITEPITYCGLSMGGYIAWSFLRKYQRRLRALVLCDTLSTADTREGVEKRFKNADRVLREGTSFLADEMIPRLLSPVSLEQRPAVEAAVRRMILSASPESVAAALHGMAHRIDSTGLLSSIKTPTLVLCGADDAISTRAQMLQMASAIPDSEYVEIPRAGHMAPCERPDFVNAALACFLERVHDTAPVSTL